MRENRFQDWERVFAAAEDGEIVGFCTLTESDELPAGHGLSPFIGFVFVDERHRGHRLSEWMIDAACGYARGLGYSKIYIVSDERGLYEKYGFTCLGEYGTIFDTVDQLFVRELRTGILVCGLNGAGKSTLGRSLAERLGIRFIDNEDLYFHGSGDYKYASPRPREEVERLLLEQIREGESFVFTSVRGDFNGALPYFTCAVLVETPRQTRLSRINARSLDRFGERTLPGGDLYDSERRFFEFAAARPEDYAESWLASLPRPILRVDGTRPVIDNVELIVQWLGV